MYLLDQNMIQKNEEFVAIKNYFWIYYQINQRVFNEGINIFPFPAARNSHHIWIRSVNTLTPQITKLIPMVKCGEWLLT